MNTLAIQLSPALYHSLTERAARSQQPPARYVEELLTALILPPHPYVEIIQSHSEPRAVVKGTRIGVDVIIGYIQAGQTPRQLADEIFPQLTMAQIYDALSYYEDHRATIETALKDNTPSLWRDRLEQRMGKAAVTQLLGA